MHTEFWCTEKGSFQCNPSLQSFGVCRVRYEKGFAPLSASVPESAPHTLELCEKGGDRI